jgi:hypothetical protein
LLNQRQKIIANEFLAKYSDLGINYVDFIDGELEIYFKNSIANPWTAREFKVGSTMRSLLESLENKLRHANKANLDEYLNWCEDGELE